MPADRRDVPAGSFEQAWRVADPVRGWLTLEQGRLLWDEAVVLPPGSTVVEIGSHQGRSTVVLARAVAGSGSGSIVVAVDPFVEGRLFGGASTEQLFEANLTAAGVRDIVTLVRDHSTRARPTWTRPFDLLYVDGKHDYWTLTDDLRWADHLPEGAAVLVHDCFSSIGVTLGILATVLPGHRLRYERRAGSLALFRVGRPDRADRLRIVAQLPWWVRNVGIKVLLRLRLRPLARVAGHDSEYDPY